MMSYAYDGISDHIWFANPGVFLPRETETMFVIGAHLKGFRKSNLKLDISADGSQLTITGEKPIQKHSPDKKHREISGFEKIIKIPDGVDVDGIIAKFEEDVSLLLVKMPKLKNVMLGIEVQEVLEQENMKLRPLSSKLCRVGDYQPPRLYYQEWALLEPADGKMQPKFGTPEEKPDTNNQIATDGSHVQAPVDMQEEKSSRQEKDSPKMKIEHEEAADHDGPCEHGPTVTEKAGKPEGGKDAWETDDGRHVSKKESSSVFTPCVLMGSALIASIVVVLVGFMNKSKRQQ